MSVLIPGKDVFNYVESGLRYAAYNRTCDSLYSPVVSEFFKECGDIETESLKVVTHWMKLNDLSYSIRYNQEPEEKYSLRNSSIKVEAFQLLKYLQCIEYNI